ncbi:MAG TPA: hypothetical protein VEL47_01395 [Myxococcota bacterium]|nr:hypothetical protein [Myxococcota bacterium]
MKLLNNYGKIALLFCAAAMFTASGYAQTIPLFDIWNRSPSEGVQSSYRVLVRVPGLGSVGLGAGEVAKNIKLNGPLPDTFDVEISQGGKCRLKATIMRFGQTAYVEYDYKANKLVPDAGSLFRGLYSKSAGGYPLDNNIKAGNIRNKSCD